MVTMLDAAMPVAPQGIAANIKSADTVLYITVSTNNLLESPQVSMTTPVESRAGFKDATTPNIRKNAVAAIHFGPKSIWVISSAYTATNAPNGMVAKLITNTIRWKYRR